MDITLIGNRTREHLHMPGVPGIAERDGGPVAMAENVLRSYHDVRTRTVTSGVASWVDVSLEDGSSSVVTDSPVKIHGILDAAAFLILPLTAGVFTFDLDMLAGKIAVAGSGLARTVNSRKRVRLAVPERALPLIDVFVLPWEDRGLLPAGAVKELKAKHVFLLTKGTNGVELFDHGAKHSLSATAPASAVLALDQEACFLATFMAQYLRSKDAVMAAKLGCDAVAERLQDPNAVPLAA